MTFDEGHNANCVHAECRYAKCHNDERHFDKCPNANGICAEYAVSLC